MLMLNTNHHKYDKLSILHIRFHFSFLKLSVVVAVSIIYYAKGSQIHICQLTNSSSPVTKPNNYFQKLKVSRIFSISF